ncbi:MAG: hypothetical protein KBG77_15485 [Dermatophilaceae bacterium]|nr:hypothetical protein [Dermatophilaceae bacterium]
MSAQQRVVLLDTDVFSALFVTPEAKARSQGYLLDQWRAAVRGYRVVIAFQTRAEALVGARLDRWIAACAIAKAIPLLSGDRIFKGAPSLSLLALPELPK